MQASKPIDVRDMAIVHRLFRQAYAEAARLVRAGPAPSPGRVTFLADHIDFALAALHHHHEGEDALLYPKLIARVPEQAPMTEQVEHEHLLIKTALDAASAACAAWRPRLRPVKPWRRRSTISTRWPSRTSTTRSRRWSRSLR